MRTPRALLVLGGAVVALPFVFAGVAQADPAPAPTPPPAAVAPTGPAYVCDTVWSVPPATYGYTNCQPFGDVQQPNAFIIDTKRYLLIPRTGDTRQKYSCYGGYDDLPTAIAPKHCDPVGSAVPAAQASPAPPFTPGPWK
jgi:hypothetical protein